jgi:hypothetical protein
MRTNPNIILSGNQMAAPQLPDVNAMTQTRTAGMENIYAIEQQREARAQAAQKEQAAAQEAALTQALLPAYTYGIQTGDIAGAFDLVPPEMQANLAPYVQALEGKNPEEVRSALIGSLSASKAGQEALAAMQRAETAGIQRGQLELSRQRLAQDAAAANQPPQVSPDKAAELEYRREKDAADRAAEAATPEGMDAKTKVKFEQAYPKSASALRTSVSNMDNDLAALEQLINDPGLKSISGTLGARTVNLSADAKRAQSLFDRVKAGAGLAALVELKQSSPAGGALGNVSNQEGNTLRESRGEFLQDQEYNDLRNALIRYYNVLERSKANIMAAFDDTYSYRGENASADILQAAQEQFRDLEIKTKEKFGEPPATGAFRIRNVRQQ